MFPEPLDSSFLGREAVYVSAKEEEMFPLGSQAAVIHWFSSDSEYSVIMLGRR